MRATADRSGALRIAALVAVAIGAAGSLAFTLRAGQRTPRFLLIVFLVWIASPFVALAWANVNSMRWPNVTRVTLFCVSAVTMIGSLAVYGGIVRRPAGSANAAMFVLGPLGAWLLIAIVIAVHAFSTRGRRII